MESNVIFPDLPTYTGVVSLAGLLSLLVDVALPVLAALFMRTHWSASAKGLVLLAFAAVKSFAEAWIVAEHAGRAFDIGQVAYSIGVSFVIAVVSFYGFGVRGSRVQQAALRGGVLRSKVIDGQVV